MNRRVIGIDPDSDKHGVALYVDGQLLKLWNVNLIDFMDSILKFNLDATFHIEDVCANNATFAKVGVKNARANQAVARGVGKCQQAQVELMRVLDHYGVKYRRHKISKKWKKGDEFKRVTGWKGRSNEETRSAAYFGYIGLNCNA